MKDKDLNKFKSKGGTRPSPQFTLCINELGVKYTKIYTIF